MLAFESVTHRDLLSLQDALRDKLHAAHSLEACAQHGVESLCHAFRGEVALARLFMTLPFGTLPDPLRKAAWSVVEAQSLQSQMQPMTPILTLLGTCGKAPGWCDRRASRGHAAIPLSSKSFVDSIPMVARMLQEMGVDLGLKLDAERPYVQKVLGTGWVGLFYVDDARTARDDQGRRVIPSTDFVEQHSIRTVFGLGKAYGNGSIACVVVFANQLVPKHAVEALIPWMNAFRAATIDLVNQGAIFAPDPGDPHPG